VAKKGRKWSNLKGAVPEQPVELSARELQIREDMAKHTGKAMRELAQEYQGLVEEEEFADLATKKRGVAYEALERLIGTELERVKDFSGQDTWRGEGQTFSPKISVIPVVADKGALMQHIRATGQEALLTLEYPKLKSLVVNILEELAVMTPAQRAVCTINLEEPIPGVKLFIKPGVHRTKS
jgi:hypothetical protein